MADTKTDKTEANPLETFEQEAKQHGFHARANEGFTPDISTADGQVLAHPMPNVATRTEYEGKRLSDMSDTERADAMEKLGYTNVPVEPAPEPAKVANATPKGTPVGPAPVTKTP